LAVKVFLKLKYYKTKVLCRLANKYFNFREYFILEKKMADLKFSIRKIMKFGRILHFLKLKYLLDVGGMPPVGQASA
jgi:hypothetical protein